jgi:hypothetical protein
MLQLIKHEYPELYIRGQTTHNSWELRSKFIERYGWSCFSNYIIGRLAAACVGNVIDVGAGNGYLAHRLEQLGIDVTALDDGSWDKLTHTIWKRDITDSVENILIAAYNVVILSWPPYDKPFAHNTAKAMIPGQLLIYIGEGCGGCTGDDAFHEYLDNNFEEQCTDINEYHTQFYGLHDSIYFYRKNR